MNAPSGSGERVSLSLANAELAVMDLLWGSDALTAREIRERLYPAATKAQHGTVQRLLGRLEEKGFVGRDRSLGVQSFSARVSRHEYAAGQLESLAVKLTTGSITPMLTHLVENRKISPEEIARLRRVLDEAAAEGDRP